MTAGLLLLTDGFLVPSAVKASFQKLLPFAAPLPDSFYRFEAQIESADPSDTNIFFIGSSQLREGVDALYLEAGLRQQGPAPIRVKNFGTSSSVSIDQYLQLPLVLKKKPELVVVMNSWRFFYLKYEMVKFKYSTHSLKQVLKAVILYGPARFLKDAGDELPDILCASFFRSFRYIRLYRIPEIAQRYMQAKDKNRAPRWYAYGEARAPEAQIEKYAGMQIEITEAAEIKKRFFVKMIRDLKVSGARVLVVEAPYHPRVEAKTNRAAGAWPEYENFMRQTARELDFEYISAGDLPVFEEEDFLDTTHLGAAGRRKFSRYLLSLKAFDPWRPESSGTGSGPLSAG